ncbi:unnamed protein product [Thelazia callipaeda]|uniref:Chloride channel CLIC-like protein 1 n=1 Tax=Thelazia callipaeda TaxID=103827 RepID=A0A0N5CYK2_THECL|nr:unnamed protein product [Thelazia callipaeda]
MNLLAFILYIFSLFLSNNAVNVGLDLSTGQTNWLDPNDPLTPSMSSFCNKETLDELVVCRADLEKCIKGSKVYKFVVFCYELKHMHGVSYRHGGNYLVSDPTLKHIIRNFFHRMNVDLDNAQRIDRTIDVYVNSENLAVLKDYLNSEGETVGQRERMREVLEKIVVPHAYEDKLFIYSILDLIAKFLPLFNILILVPAVIILYRSCFSLYSLIWLILLVAFIVSVIFTFRMKYQDLYVDALYEIAPLDVIFEVFTSFIFTPLGVFGRHLNTFFFEFYHETPLLITVVKTLTLFSLLIFLFFWLGGYRLRTLVATVEPAGKFLFSEAANK